MYPTQFNYHRPDLSAQLKKKIKYICSILSSNQVIIQQYIKSKNILKDIFKQRTDKEATDGSEFHLKSVKYSIIKRESIAKLDKRQKCQHDMVE